MASSLSTSAVMGAIFGVILIFYLVANTFNDASDEIATINESHKGGKFMKLLPLFLAFGVVFTVYKMMVGSK